MDDSNVVTVYSFRVYTGHAERPQVSPHKATKEAIVQLGGELLKGTAQQVPARALDPQGHFRRVATGWGELN
ncbi:MAG: hypothetical protein IV094_02530 [Vitreoscilla sp.]|nr:hypothetical protein [Vitreoscilla sp.]